MCFKAWDAYSDAVSSHMLTTLQGYLSALSTPKGRLETVSLDYTEYLASTVPVKAPVRGVVTG